MIDGLAVYSITYLSDLAEKTWIVAEGRPLASACLLISVTFNTVLFSPLCTLSPPFELVNAVFVWLPIFHALTQDELSSPAKKPPLSPSL